MMQLIDQLVPHNKIVDSKKSLVHELSPHQLGIPQQRERVIFVCIRNDLYKESIELDMTPPNYPIDFDKIIETDKEKTKKYRISDEHENILEIWDEMVKHFDVGQSMSPTILCNEFCRKI